MEEGILDPGSKARGGEATILKPILTKQRRLAPSWTLAIPLRQPCLVRVDEVVPGAMLELGGVGGAGRAKAPWGAKVPALDVGKALKGTAGGLPPAWFAGVWGVPLAAVPGPPVSPGKRRWCRSGNWEATAGTCQNRGLGFVLPHEYLLGACRFLRALSAFSPAWLAFLQTWVTACGLSENGFLCGL